MQPGTHLKFSPPEETDAPAEVPAAAASPAQAPKSVGTPGSSAKKQAHRSPFNSSRVSQPAPAIAMELSGKPCIKHDPHLPGLWGAYVVSAGEAGPIVIAGGAAANGAPATGFRLLRGGEVSAPTATDSTQLDRAWGGAVHVPGLGALVMGGRTARGEGPVDVIVVDHDCSVCYPAGTSGSEPKPRSAFATALLPREGTDTAGKALLVGGSRGKRWLNDVYMLDISSFRWSRKQVGGSPPGPRGYHTLTSMGRQIVLLGGCDTDRAFNDVQVLNLAGGSWFWSEQMCTGGTPQPRAAHCAVAVSHRHIFVAGGWDVAVDEAEEDLELQTSAAAQASRRRRLRRDAWILDVETWHWTPLAHALGMDAGDEVVCAVPTAGAAASAGQKRPRGTTSSRAPKRSRRSSARSTTHATQDDELQPVLAASAAEYGQLSGKWSAWGDAVARAGAGAALARSEHDEYAVHVVLVGGITEQGVSNDMVYLPMPGMVTAARRAHALGEDVASEDAAAEANAATGTSTQCESASITAASAGLPASISVQPNDAGASYPGTSAGTQIPLAQTQQQHSAAPAAAALASSTGMLSPGAGQAAATMMSTPASSCSHGAEESPLRLLVQDFASPGNFLSPVGLRALGLPGSSSGRDGGSGGRGRSSLISPGGLFSDGSGLPQIDLDQL